MTQTKVLAVIVGPTAVGKTAVAVDVALRLNAEIVSADSRQLYREMNIGTAKPVASELEKVKHHFINSHSISEDYDAAAFGRDAIDLIEQLFKKMDYVVLCGGSGLYVRAVCEGFDNIPAVDPVIREQLIRGFREHGIEWLQQKMMELDPGHYAGIDRRNPHRLIRALEVVMGTGQSITAYRNRARLEHSFSIAKVGLDLPRAELYKRIDARMDAMIRDGLFKEAEELYAFRQKNALQTVGYQEVFDYLDGKCDYAETVRLLKRNSRRYAKRQLTWFRKDPDITWFHPGQVDEIIDHITLCK